MFHALDASLGSTFFWAFALITVVCSTGLLLARHPINGAINLIGVMLSLSGIYALLNSPFLAVLQVLVYAGAIMMLVVFVIMVLNQARDHVIPQFDWFSLVALPLPVAIGAALIAVLAASPSASVTSGETARILSPSANAQSLNVRFRAADAGPAATYAWTFSDQQSASGREVVHHFAKPGSYSAALKVDDGGPAPHLAEVSVQVAEPVRGTVQALSVAMFDTRASGPGYYLLFEAIGVLLLAAVVGAVVLAKRSLDSPAPPAETLVETSEGQH
jgi:NADH:ubiquinone oxidoreductase subunit 6 (subunit J)